MFYFCGCCQLFLHVRQILLQWKLLAMESLNSSMNFIRHPTWHSRLCRYDRKLCSPTKTVKYSEVDKNKIYWDKPYLVICRSDEKENFKFEHFNNSLRANVKHAVFIYQYDYFIIINSKTYQDTSEMENKLSFMFHVLTHDIENREQIKQFFSVSAAFLRNQTIVDGYPKLSTSFRQQRCNGNRVILFS